MLLLLLLLLLLMYTCKLLIVSTACTLLGLLHTCSYIFTRCLCIVDVELDKTLECLDTAKSSIEMTMV